MLPRQLERGGNLVQQRVVRVECPFGRLIGIHLRKFGFLVGFVLEVFLIFQARERQRCFERIFKFMRDLGGDRIGAFRQRRDQGQYLRRRNELVEIFEMVFTGADCSGANGAERQSDITLYIGRDVL